MRIGHIEVDSPWLVDEQLDFLRTVVFRSLELERMNLDHLFKGNGQYELLIAVGLKEFARTGQAVLHRMIVRLVQAFAFVLRYEHIQIHL